MFGIEGEQGNKEETYEKESEGSARKEERKHEEEDKDCKENRGR